MPHFDDFTDTERRHLVHVYGALQECIKDELAYDFEGFAPLDDATRRQAHALIYTQLQTLMEVMHAGEAAQMQAEVDAWWAAETVKMAQLSARTED